MDRDGSILYIMYKYQLSLIDTHDKIVLWTELDDHL